MAATPGKWINTARLCQWRLELEKGGRCTKVVIPSLGGSVFNRQGLISAPALQSLLTQARIAAYHLVPEGAVTPFVEYDKLTSDRFTFVASTRTWYAQDILLIPNSPRFAVHVELTHVGMASLSSRARLVEENTNTVIADNTNQVVSVSKQTRKPIPLPDWWTDKYRAWVADGDGKLIVPALQVAEDAYRYPLRVTWSNTDGYGHTNYVAYINFCYDAAMDAIQHGYLDNFHEDICCYEARETRMSYKNESKAGDDLVVSMWPNKDNPFTLHFNITNDSVVLYQCTIEFYEPRLH